MQNAWNQAWAKLRRYGTAAATVGLVWASAAVAFAQDEAAAAAPAAPTINAGDTAWVLISSAIVLMMTVPALALFYGGLVRAKNVLSILMQCMAAAGLIGVLWILAGYSLAFDTGNLFIGGLTKAGLSGIAPDTISALAPTIPEYVFVMFQLMFAIITPALMIGAFAERMRFSAYLAFITMWLFVVYIPLAHNVWGGGWIGSVLGAKDFAGGLVVHMSSGFSALVTAIFLGKRHGFGREPMPPHSLPLTVIGATLLWVGWFGFNAGSALAANGTAALAFITTQTATSAAVVAWVAIEWLHRKKPTALGGASAAVAGLVAITPACGFVSPLSSILIGAGASVVCYIAVTVLKPAWGYDDSLDVFGVHGVGGTWGALATGLFMLPSLRPEGMTWGGQVVAQLVSIGITAVYSMSCTFVILLVLRAVMGSLRVSEDGEAEGLDLSLHSESAYADISAGTLIGSALGERLRESAAMSGSGVTARESAHAV